MADGDYYAPRSMVVYKVTINERNHPDDLVPIGDVGGLHIGRLFKDFCIDGAGDLREAERAGRYLRILEPRDVDGGVLVSLLSGAAGDDRQVFDVDSAVKRFDLGVRDASMVSVRALLSWKGTGTGYALMCIEHSVNAAGDTVLFGPFKRHLRSVAPNVVAKFEAVIEAEALDEFESLEKVEVRRYLGQGDSVDQLTREGDSISYVISHKRGRPFGVGVIKDFLREKKNPAVLFGYAGTPLDSSQSKIFVTLKDARNRTRTFGIYDDYGMKVREELTPYGAKPLSDEEFVAACGDRCETIIERLGKMI